MDNYKDDIDKYLKGQLTPAQMHALEKKALSDPFLADALEGLGSLPPNDLQSDMKALRDQVNKRLNKKSAITSWVFRIAAGLVLLAISTFIIISIARKDSTPSENLALNKEQEPDVEQREQSLPPSVTDSVAEDIEVLPPQSKQEELKAKAEKPAVTRDPELQKAQPTQPSVASGPADDGKDVPVPQQESDISRVDETLAEQVEEERLAQNIPKGAAPATGIPQRLSDKKAEDGELSKSKASSGLRAREGAASSTVARKIIRGRVTFADDNTGLPGVNVLVTGTNEGTVTDAQGNYQIAVAEQNTTLSFSFIGFSSKELEPTGDELNVQLETDVSELSEVVVVGYGASDDVGFLPSTPSVMELAAPEGGRKMYKQYLEQNLKYPEQALENNIEGKVTVQFTIGMTGQLSDFRVIRGLGYGCEEEVIRLIKQGPKWAPTKRNEQPIKDRVRIRMRFSLPKK